MSTAPSTTPRLSLPTKLSPVVDELSVLVCPRCDSNRWVLETDGELRCESCRAVMFIGDRIVHCLEPEGKVSSTVTKWDSFYQGNLRAYSSRADWWTLYCWRKYLFEAVIHDLPGKLIIDFGCGRAARIAEIAPIQAHAYRYVGVDSSLQALKYATEALPGAFFIHADLGSIRLQRNSADIVLCLGILMYFPKFSQMLAGLLGALKPGGVLLLHEQIRRKSWGQLVRSFFGSPNDVYPSSYGIRVKELRDYLAKHGSIARIHLRGSPLRRLFVRLLDDTPFERLRRCAAWADSLWCDTIGRALPALGHRKFSSSFKKLDNAS